MFKALYISLLTCLCLIGQGQVLNFNSMEAKSTNNYIRSCGVDNAGNVYVGGDYSLINGVHYWGVAKWDGTKWDSLGSGSHIPGQSLNSSYGARGLAVYQNDVYVGGNMQLMGGKLVHYIARWHNAQWDSLPQSPNANVDRLIVLNGKLYVFGIFNKIGTTNCNKMAVWDGISWTAISMPYYVADFADIAEYKGELYLGGNIFEYNGGPNVDLIKFDGTNWVPVAGGIKGGTSWVNALKVFNNELYIGGYFEKGAGNAGDFLMKWDGNNYKEVIHGLDGQIFDLTEVPDGLIGTGCFDNPFLSVLKISNNGVCGYSDLFNNCIQGSRYANNKLYFYGGFMTVNGDSTLGFVNNVNYISQTDSCQAFVTEINEVDLSTIKIYPNPTSLTLNVVDEQNELQGATVEITNSIGQSVSKIAYTQSIDVSGLSNGCYFLNIIIENKRVLHSKFIKEQ